MADNARLPQATRLPRLNLFLIGFLVLFLELACIRWFAASVVFLQFFTNVVLIASFLGLSCGCLVAGRRRDWMAYFPFIALGTVAAALLTLQIYHFWSGLVVDIGRQASPQEVFFGTEYRDPDVAQFVVPIEAVAAVFFALVALMFVGLGQALGRAFDAYPNRVLGYTLNIGGSLAGIVAFSAVSAIQAPPWAWFLVVFAGIAFLLHQTGSLGWGKGLGLIAVVVAVGVPIDEFGPNREIRWSPYYRVDHDMGSGYIEVNRISHQTMVPFASEGAPYSLIHLLQRHSSGAPFRDVLVIGAGSGNDVAHALRFGADRIDAVEIDPVIQDIGIHYHPDRPYQDARVSPHLDDGRHFLRSTEGKYDLVVYALVDSLIMHSGYANIRLESYLFTLQAFADIRRVLKPDGIFVMYNYLRQGWIVERIVAMAEITFGCAPIVISLPFAEAIPASSPAGSFATIIAGCNHRIADAFRQSKSFWLDLVPPGNLEIDGFAIDPEKSAPDAQQRYQRIAPARLVHDRGPVSAASDDWPFLYLRDRSIPDFTVRSMLILGFFGIGMVYLFLPKGPIALDSRMFFLGAGFMLLETKAVVQLALLFGSTWAVNSAVFFTVLVLILMANLYVLKLSRVRLAWHYCGLLLLLGAGVLVPTDLFLSGGIVWRYVIPCMIVLGPIFFAAVIFAQQFREAPNPDRALGSNIAGAVLGGLAESCSAVLGFQYLLFVAIGFYLFSAWLPRLQRAPA
jgi:SAM-dependent methyltransferase